MMIVISTSETHIYYWDVVINVITVFCRSLMRITPAHLISHSGLNGNKYFDEL